MMFVRSSTNLLHFVMIWQNSWLPLVIHVSDWLKLYKCFLLWTVGTNNVLEIFRRNSLFHIYSAEIPCFIYFAEIPCFIYTLQKFLVSYTLQKFLVSYILCRNSLFHILCRNSCFWMVEITKILSAATHVQLQVQMIFILVHVIFVRSSTGMPHFLRNHKLTCF
jgi:hypothetical protein